MKNALKQMRQHWIINLIVFLSSLLVGGGIFCLFFFLRDKTISAALDGASVATIVVLFVGLLLFVAHLGAFDTFAFGFRQLGAAMFSKEPTKEGTYQDYRNKKSIERAASSFYFFAIILAGLFLSISIIVLEIIYHIYL